MTRVLIIIIIIIIIIILGNKKVTIRILEHRMLYRSSEGSKNKCQCCLCKSLFSMENGRC